MMMMTTIFNFGLCIIAISLLIEAMVLGILGIKKLVKEMKESEKYKNV